MAKQKQGRKANRGKKRAKQPVETKPAASPAPTGSPVLYSTEAPFSRGPSSAGPQQTSYEAAPAEETEESKNFVTYTLMRNGSDTPFTFTVERRSGSQIVLIIEPEHSAYVSMFPGLKPRNLVDAMNATFFTRISLKCSPLVLKAALDKTPLVRPAWCIVHQNVILVFNDNEFAHGNCVARVDNMIREHGLEYRRNAIARVDTALKAGFFLIPAFDSVLVVVDQLTWAERYEKLELQERMEKMKLQTIVEAEEETETEVEVVGDSKEVNDEEEIEELIREVGGMLLKDNKEEGASGKVSNPDEGEKADSGEKNL